MAVLIKLEVPADGIMRPYDSKSGKYLKAYNPDVNGFKGDIQVTADRADAMRFPDAAAAAAYWRQQSKTLPHRPDGAPNRPLTAFTVTLERG